MDKNTYYETVKNMAVEKVLNQYCSDSDPSRSALKKLLKDLLDWFMLSERQIYLLKNENDKGNGILPEPYKRVDESYTGLCPLLSTVIQNLLS